MKKRVLLAILVLCGVASYADHIKGGWIYYEYLGAGTINPAHHRYRVIVKVYRDCGTGSADPTNPQNSPTAAITIFAGTSATIVQTVHAPRTNLYTLQKGTPNPCMTTPPQVCYRILQYEIVVELPPTAAGYTLSYQRCCRISGIQNLMPPTNQWGNTYTVLIPGTSLNNDYPKNTTAKFVEKDTAVICYNAPFTLDYAATDADGDSLTYSLCGALHGGSSAGSGAAPDPSGPPPYNNVGYSLPYTANDPFATGITINSNGLISGNAPATPGEYVISVCVNEYRNGNLLNTVRKELHVIVGNCTVAAADLNPQPAICSGFTGSFQNGSPSAGITGYAWNFGDPGSGASNTSNSPTPTHTFSDTGRFLIKLVVTSIGGCLDSAETIVPVYPTFNTDFNFNGNCFQSPFNFQDGTTSTHGQVNTWRWDFDITLPGNDTSNVQHPSFLYPSGGPRSVRLITTNEKGCVDTTVKTVNVRDNPLLTLPFRDTLICSIDNLPLLAQGTGNFSWIAEPADPTLTTPTIANPVVSPDDTTRYIVTLNDNGCIKKDTINVNVLTFISVDLGQDTGICRTDTIVMKTQSHALSYQWSPAEGLSSTTEKAPFAFPGVTTTYYVQANLGLCPAYDTVTIQVAPYPIADAGGGATICYGEKVRLNANYVGTGFAWSPTSSLQNPNSLTPYAGPMKTTAYVFTAMSAGICPKPSHDTVLVTVMPIVQAFAGNDTAITALQPLQLQASGGTTYSWSPSFGLSATNIPNPIATLPNTVDEMIYRVRATDTAGCFADADIKVTVFKTGPQIFIPTAFTPNGDGRNEIARPVLVGMERLDYFRVYNRWGQMVYATSEVGKGWDGNFGGEPQPSGTYVFSAQAIDYTGKTVFRKGTIVLIR